VSETLLGGCFCGDVRFEVADVFDAAYCHCSICRRIAGAPAVLFAIAPAASFRITQGKPTGFASSPDWVRYFCPRCGTAVYGARPSNEDDAAFSIALLDQPEAVRPTAHIWCSSQLS
jgi:hypothetical protein